MTGISSPRSSRALTATLVLLAGLVLTLPSTANAKTNLKVSSMTVDGFTVIDVDCQLTGGGFLAGAMLIGSLAKQKKAVDKCGPAGQATRVEFLLGGKGPKSVKVLASSSGKGGKCVAKVLKKARTKLKGVCRMTVLSGPKAAAKKKAAGLKKP